MPKYWVKNYFAHRSSPKWVKSKRWGENDGNNNGQLRIANATLCGAHKPPGPK